MFDYATIRKTARTIGLITDASQRYEKSLDPEQTPVALARILYILKNIDSGVEISSSFSDCYKKKFDKISIKYFIPDLKKEGGAYQKITGNVTKIDKKEN